MYDLLKSVYDKHGFDSNPEAIYNMDKTGVPLEPWPPKVLKLHLQKEEESMLWHFRANFATTHNFCSKAVKCTMDSG